MKRVKWPWFVLGIFLLLGASSVPRSFKSASVLPLTDEGYFPAVHEVLKGAKQSILCVMYLAKYDSKFPNGPEATLLGDLINAHKRGVQVFVVLDRTRYHEAGTDDKNQAAFAFLKDGGVPVVYDEIDRATHSKILIVDDALTILGSTNWTYSALKRNHESAVLIQSEKVAQVFKKKLMEIKTE